MELWRRLTALSFLPGALLGCVSETVHEEGPGAAPLFRFPAGGVLGSGIYHGVSFFFELDPRSDLSPEEIAWMNRSPEELRKMEREGIKKNDNWIQLPPIVPEYSGNLEIYRYRDLHRVDLFNGMFHVGNSRYLPQPRGRLYVFKERAGDFSFVFREQKISVPATKTWIPSIFYHPEEESRADGSKLLREVVQVGSAKIETATGEAGNWLVNGKLYKPDPGRVLELPGGAL